MNDRRRSSSLRVQILSRTLIVGLVPLVILATVAVLGLRKLDATADSGVAEARRVIARETGTERVLVDAASTSREINLALVELIGELAVTARDPRLVTATEAPDTENASELLASFIDSHPDFVDLRHTDGTGNVLGSGGTSSGSNPTEAPVWHRALGVGFAVGDVVLHDTTGSPVVPVAVRIINASGAAVGVLHASVDIGFVQPIADLHAVGGSDIAVLTADSLLLAETRTDHESDRIGQPMPDLDPLQPGGERATERPAGAFSDDNGVHGYISARLGGRYANTIDAEAPSWTVLATNSAVGAPAPMTELENLSQEINGAIRELSFVIGVMVLFAAFVAAAVAAVLTKRIVVPITDLTERARSVADEELPNAVSQQLRVGGGTVAAIDMTVETGAENELGDLARSFNSVQRTAIRLAEEQAAHRRNTMEMFANLGRRCQSLVKRQLLAIDELEQSEEDPARLSSLFGLDHLTTRMRRSADSFLVISGHRPSTPRTEPVHLEMVVQGALAAVEHYERVDVDLEPGALIGHAVADVAHMAAELIENALIQSPSDARVRVVGWSGPLHYTLRVVDHGLGMTDSEIETANARLRADTDIQSQPSKQLGHIVVAALAHRHEIAVRLGRTVEGGIEAVVEIPNRLFEPLQVSGDDAPGADHPADASPEHRPDHAGDPTATAIAFADQIDQIEWADHAPIESEEPDSARQPAGVRLPVSVGSAQRRARVERPSDGGPPRRVRLSPSAAARLTQVTRRPSRRETPAATDAGQLGPRPRRSIATTHSADDVQAEALELQSRWRSFQQGRRSAEQTEEGRVDGPDERRFERSNHDDG